jgi:general secretion pathway protein G
VQLKTSRAFSLIELVVVMVIIAVIAAIAVPRITGAAQGSGATALRADLKALRQAIETYRIEHEGAVPTVADFEDQLTRFSNQAGTRFADAANSANSVTLGPYLQSIPPLPVGDEKGATGVAAAAGAGTGWVYDETTGKIIAGTAKKEKDSDGVAYQDY